MLTGVKRYFFEFFEIDFALWAKRETVYELPALFCRVSERQLVEKAR